MTTADLIASVALVAGALLSALAGVAVLRFPDTESRVHAATKPQVLGIMLIMVGVGIRLGTWAVIGQLVLIVLLQLFTAPVSAHLVVRRAHRTGEREPVQQAGFVGPDGAGGEVDGAGSGVDGAGGGVGSDR